jgi:heme oxygenase
MIPLQALSFTSQSFTKMENYTKSIQVRLKEKTERIHAETEKKPFMQQLVKGEVSEKAYVQYLVDLYIYYQAMEEELQKIPLLKSLCIPELFRTNKLLQDLEKFNAKENAPGEAVHTAAIRIHSLSGMNQYLLIGHAYTRFLGDLFGGQIIKKKIENVFPGKTAFYDYNEWLAKEPQCKNGFALAQKLRDVFNSLEIPSEYVEDIENEAIKAFMIAGDMLTELERIPGWNKPSKSI